jgi:hypothetical protein
MGLRETPEAHAIVRKSPTNPRGREEFSETDVGAEGDAQIVVCAAGEINFIADVEPKTDGAEMAFETAARVEDSGEVICAEILDGTYRVADRGGATIEKEVVETALYREEGMKLVMAELELGADETVENADIGARDCDGRRNGGVVRKTFGEDAVKVVAHFGFEHDGFVDMEAETRADAGKIGFGLRKAKIIGINAGLHVIVLSKRDWREANYE